MATISTIKIANVYHAQQSPLYCNAACIEMTLDSPAVLATNPTLNQALPLYTANKSTITFPQPNPGGQSTVSTTVLNGDFGFQDSMYLVAYGNSIPAYNAAYAAGMGMTTPMIAAVLNNQDGPPTGVHNYKSPNASAEGAADQALAQSIISTGVPAEAVVLNGNHIINVYGVDTSVTVTNGSGSILGFFIHDPWTGFALENPGAVNGEMGLGENSYFKVGGEWSRIFQPPTAKTGYQFVVEQPATANSISGGNTADGSVATAQSAASDSAASEPASIATAGEAVTAAIADLAADPSLSSEPGLSGGSFDAGTVTDVTLPGQSGGDSDWVVAYEGAGGTNDVTGMLYIDSLTGTVDEATWFNPDDPTTSITTAQMSTMVNDEVANLVPADNLTETACYCAGTAILTGAGERPVETLKPGDLVVTRHGGLEPVTWVGHRRVDCARHPKPADVWPVRVRAGAFRPGIPRRDLWLSPDHAVFTHGVLIPIRYLINGATIRQEAVPVTTYWHVELNSHNVIFAEGLPAETFLDTGNRNAFANGGASVDLHPDFALQIWRAKAYAPLVRSGRRLGFVRACLLRRAEALGFRIDRDPGLYLLAGGRPAQARIVAGSLHRFSIPASATEVRIVSNAATPSEVSTASDDCRRLGIMIEQIVVRQTARRQVVGLATLKSEDGFHRLETDGKTHWRWTNGDARIHLPPNESAEGNITVDIVMRSNQPTWIPPAVATDGLRLSQFAVGRGRKYC